MAAFIVLVVAAAAVAALIDFGHWRPPNYMADAERQQRHQGAEAVAMADQTIAAIRHAPTVATARTALARASRAADRAGSAFHVARARQQFVARIHELANQEEIKDSPWKAAEVLKEALPYADDSQAVRDAIKALTGEGGTSDGGVF